MACCQLHSSNCQMIQSCSHRPLLRCVAVMFPELFYCQNICILRAHWEEPPSKHSPWAAMHLSQLCCHCWKQFCSCCCGVAFSVIITFFWMSSVSWGLRHFKAYFISGRSQKSCGAKSREYSVCSISVIDFCARNCLTESALWTGALSWWRIQL
jgi:hypothetical protein